MLLSQEESKDSNNRRSVKSTVKYYFILWSALNLKLNCFTLSYRRRKSTLEKSSIDGQVHKVTESEIFLRNVREMYPSLPKKIQSAIDKFAMRIDFENKEILKIKNMFNEKPNDVNIEEEAILNNAWETIGNFNLKTASDFKPSEDQVILIEHKFEQYKNVQNEVSFQLF